jgi:hypothetical protein
MNVLAWFHYIVALVYPAALPDSVSPAQAQPVKKVIQIERVITNAQGDTIEHEIRLNNDAPDVQVVTHQTGSTDLVGLLIPIVFLLVGASLLWKVTDTDKQVKLAMTEKGLDLSTLKGRDATKKFGALRFGMLLVGISTGLLAGFLINSLLSVAADSHEIVVATTTIFFAGLSLIIYHMVAASLNKSH